MNKKINKIVLYIGIMTSNFCPKNRLSESMIIKNKLIAIVLIGLAMCSLFISTTSAKEITVDINRGADFTKIQDAINAADTGDVIIVKSGTYKEHLVIKKQITLKGENFPVVDGEWTGTVIKIMADGVRIEGFEVIRSDKAENSGAAGIRTANKNIIDYCIFNDNNIGVSIVGDYNKVVNSKFKDNRIGLVIHNSKQNTVKNNHFSGSSGLILDNAKNNLITDNIFRLDQYFGIHIYNKAKDNTIVNNIIQSNAMSGFEINSHGEPRFMSHNNKIYHNNIIDNGNDFQAYDDGNNQWDNGAEGNYWSDYKGKDADKNGIGDTPYDRIGKDFVTNEKSGAKDNYPLMKPLSLDPKIDGPLSSEVRGVFVRPINLFQKVNITNETEVNRTIEKMANDLNHHNINVAFVAFKSDFGDGLLFYEPDLFPDGYYFKNTDLKYDPMANMVDILHRYHIEIHAWVPVFHDKFLIDNKDSICRDLGLGDPEEVRQPFKKDSKIEYYDEFVDPNNECVLKYEESIIEEILHKYQVDGINLDYIRYNDSNEAYSTSKEIYNTDGADKITDFVRKVRDRCCKEDVILSADVFGNIEYARSTAGQDIPGISKYVNILMPMLYDRCPDGSEEQGMDYSVKKFKEYNRLVVPSVRAFNWNARPEWAQECDPIKHSPDDVKQLIRDSEKSGDGFALFIYSTIVAKQWRMSFNGEELDWNNGLDELNEVLYNPIIAPWKNSDWVNNICASDQTPTAMPTTPTNKTPAFSAIFAVFGLLVVAYVLKRRT